MSYGSLTFKLTFCYKRHATLSGRLALHMISKSAAFVDGPGADQVANITTLQLRLLMPGWDEDYGVISGFLDEKEDKVGFALDTWIEESDVSLRARSIIRREFIAQAGSVFGRTQKGQERRALEQGDFKILCAALQATG